MKEENKTNDGINEENKKLVKTMPEEKKAESVTEEKSEKKEKTKKDEKKIVKKEEAITLGKNLHLSKRHGVYLCSFIKNKNVDNAIRDLQDVIKFKKAVPFKGEIPHRKGKIMSGRYPINGSKLFITLLKGLKGNTIANGLDTNKSIIYFASAKDGFRPAKRKGGKAKRTNIILKVKEMEVKSQ